MNVNDQSDYLYFIVRGFCKILYPIDNLPHITEDLAKYRGMPIILDWELYSHWLDFQENMKLIKKYRPWESDKYIKYHIYDTIDEQSFWIRKDRTGFYSDIIVSVETYRANSENTLNEYHSLYLEQWYEGSIIRHGKQGYEMKRTQKLLKRKDFLDINVEILDIESQVADPKKGTAIVKSIEWVSMWNIFKANLKWTFEEKEDLLTNKDSYIWKTGSVRFFELSQDNIPRFPYLVEIK